MAGPTKIFRWQDAYTKAGGSLGSLGKPERAVFESMSKEINNLRQSQSLTMSNQPLTMSDTADSLNVLMNRFEEAQRSIANFANQGFGLGDDSSKFSQAMRKAIASSDTFLHNLKEGPAAMQALGSSLETGQFESFVDVLGEQAGLLATNAATLNKLGLDMRNFGRNIDTMVYSFNQSESAVKSINQQLFEFAKETKQLPNVVSQNFDLVAKSLAYSFPKIQTEFIKIQNMAAKTGVSVNKLMGTFGEQTDTISGASSFAAGLNTILGQNAFSATQILMMSESERMEATRKALKDSQIYQDYTSNDEKLKKFALRAISGRLGMSTDETRRFLDDGATPGGEGSVKSKMGTGIDKEFGKVGKKNWS